MIGSLRDKVRGAVRAKLGSGDAQRLKNKDVTVFSSNCVGAVVCHDLGMRFNSPTVNLFMEPGDYLRFLGNVRYYLDIEPLNAGVNVEGGGYPMGALGDLKLHFVHYDSFEVAKENWMRRAQRVNLSNCCAVMVDRDGCTEGQALAFNGLPYDRKVFLTHRPIDGCACAFVRPEWIEKDGSQTSDLCAFTSPFSARRKLDVFDWPAFFNSAGVCRV